MSPEEQIFAEVIYGEIIFPKNCVSGVMSKLRFSERAGDLHLHREHAHQRELIHIWLIRHRGHRTLWHVRIAIHGIHVGLDGIRPRAIHSRGRHRGRSKVDSSARVVVMWAMAVVANGEALSGWERMLSQGSAVVRRILRSAVVRVGASSAIATTTPLGTRFATFPMRIISLEVARVLVEISRAWAALEAAFVVSIVTSATVVFPMKTHVRQILVERLRVLATLERALILMLELATFLGGTVLVLSKLALLVAILGLLCVLALFRRCAVFTSGSVLRSLDVFTIGMASILGGLFGSCGS